MERSMKVVAFLPAKGTSSRITNKNVQLLDGKPLFLYTLEKLISSGIFCDVYLDTECEVIIEAAKETKCKILRRNKSLATNATDGNTLFFNEVKSVDADIYVQVLCTSPFIAIETIRKAVETISADETYDSAFLIKKEKLYEWTGGQPNYNIDAIPNSVDLKDSLIETMGLYVIKRQSALKLKRRIGEAPLLIEASPLESIDVNCYDDFLLADLIAAGIREQDRKLLGNIKANITSSDLSDILDELGYRDQVIRGLSPNINGSKILGRAKTLKLRALNDGEDYKGIYNALKSYETIVPNDIIMVENEISEFAYFGEINANLTIRSGGSGVIIDGATRDSVGVKQLGLPVFSRGTSCQDVKGRATTESFNKPIIMGNTNIDPGCLVFADTDGVVVIPFEIESEVIYRVNELKKVEKQILHEISLGVHVDDLTKRNGFF